MSVICAWLFHASVLDWTLRFYVAAAVGQTLFVLRWGPMPWWRTAIGRALMWKSTALMIVFDWSLINYWWGPFQHQELIGLALFAFVMVGIWFQTFAIDHEARRAKRERQARK
jgi:hypothetical protein